MRITAIDGHPAPGSLSGALLDRYLAALPATVTTSRLALRDMVFDPVLQRGYGAPQPLETDLVQAAEAIAGCDHLVLSFPLWWGGEPALLKGFFDRVLLPGFAFAYHQNDPMWDGLLAGRSADVIITMDTPPWYLSWAYKNAVLHRLERQVLGFCGVRPVRFFTCGPTRRGGAAKGMGRWTDKVERAARSARLLPRGKRVATNLAGARLSGVGRDGGDASAG
jgi:NAD(P)H dehydrogenase (quinone)